MSAHGMPPIGVLADDFTGAMDTGAMFARAGCGTRLLLANDALCTGPVCVLNTESRNADRFTAVRRVESAAARLADRQIYKKIDSTMRGHVGAEIGRALHVSGRAKAVVCPAVIGAGRTVRGGALWIGDALLHESDFAEDPFWPAKESGMGALISRPTSHLEREVVRAGADALAEAIRAAPEAIVTADAETDDDLRALANAIVRSEALPCGALGLAAHWLAALSGSSTVQQAPSPSIPAIQGPALIVVGTRRRSAIEQADYLATTCGVATVTLEEDDARAWPAVMERLADGAPLVLRIPDRVIADPGKMRALAASLDALVRHICEEVSLGALCITGGATAMGVCSALGVHAVQIGGELAPGIPWGTLLGGVANGLPLVTKAGGFGGRDAWAAVLNHFARHRIEP